MQKRKKLRRSTNFNNIAITKFDHATTTGNDHVIKLAASIKHVTGSYLDKKMPNNEAPVTCSCTRPQNY